MDHVVVNVTVDAVDDPEQVTPTLERAGLRVTRVRRHLGIITGAVAPSDVDALTHVPGVRAVEVDAPVGPCGPDAAAGPGSAER